MKTAVILMAVLMASEVYAKAKYYVPALVALSSLASCAIGARQASHNHSASFYCTHFDFITYSGKDTDFTQKEIQDYNKKYAVVCFDYLSNEEQKAYKRVIEQ